MSKAVNNFDMGELDTFPKILRHNAKLWPNDIAMLKKNLAFGMSLLGLIISNGSSGCRSRCVS